MTDKYSASKKLALSIGATPFAAFNFGGNYLINDSLQRIESEQGIDKAQEIAKHIVTEYPKIGIAKILMYGCKEAAKEYLDNVQGDK